MIAGLFPSLLESGGIQRASRQVAALLWETAREQGCSCHLLGLNDRPGDHQLEFDGTSFKARGFGRNKIQFALAALGLASKEAFFYIAHPNLAPLGLLLKSLHSGSRYVVAAHGTEVWERLSWLRRLGLQRASVVTSPSEFTARAIINLQHVDPTKVVVLPWAVEPKLLRHNGNARLQEATVPKGHILLTVARMDAAERLKGIDHVLGALACVLKTIPDTYYFVVGDGDDRPRFERLTKDLGIENRVIFRGNTGDEELITCYEECDVFVMPSRQEGFGLVFLEAMAFGKPVIGGDHGGTPDLILDQVNGYLVKHGDIESLAERLTRLLEDRELCRRMGEAGRRRVEDCYNFETFRRRFLEVLTSCGTQPNPKQDEESLGKAKGLFS